MAFCSLPRNFHVQFETEDNYEELLRMKPAREVCFQNYLWSIFKGGVHRQTICETKCRLDSGPFLIEKLWLFESLGSIFWIYEHK